MSTEVMFQDLLARGKSLEEHLIAFRRDLHRNPELSFHESRTASKVLEVLNGLGLEIKTGLAGHGIIADLHGGRSGRVVALRADMDALPIHEETGLPFASEREGVMHACGHDAHTAILLGAAQLLAEQRHNLAGTVRFIFQPAEEKNAGAKAMIKDGALEGVDEIFGLHNLPTLSAGKVATGYGPMMGSVDRIEISIAGKGGHGAIPDQSIDPIVASSAFIMALQSGVSREISPFDPAVITIARIQSGTANNVIPHQAELGGTVRTLSPDVQKSMQERIERLLKQTTGGYRCQSTLKYTELSPVLINTYDSAVHVEQTVDGLIGRGQRVEAEPTLGGEDFTAYLEHVPGCFFWLGSGPERNPEKAFRVHHPKFTLNEDCIGLGASLMACVAAGRLK